MRFTKFRIKNYKGIKDAEVSLNQLGQGKVFTLVGLNECGKTTVLEAINSFSPDLSAEPLYQNDVFRKVEHRDLVPKHRKDNFTGTVVIEALIDFSDDDLEAIENFFTEEHALDVDVSKITSPLSVKKEFYFQQSDYTGQKSIWSISLWAKTKRAKNFKHLNAKDDVWQSAVNFIRSLIPTICYFPTFLFEFPLRVYLSHEPEQLEPQNSYYKQIVQDVLDSLDRGLNIEEHIVDRVEKIEEGEVWSIFKFWRSDRKEQVDAVMSHLGNQITKLVFARWNEIFGSKFTKNIKIDWGIDGDEKEPPVYLSFSVQDGTSTYSIAERSLGFRWFFCFLLFTQFRKSRGGDGTLFLLDEPASNLHATAQHQLLASFETVTESQNSLIYSTHSHYMINPKWLEGAFIVQNGAIEYDEELSGESEFHVRETDIRVIPYKRFVGENNDKATYYQPILDALDYTPAILDHQAKTVMVEGKGDFYLFTYFKDVILGEDSDLRFLPSSGANDLGPLVSLYLGWGYSFRILLDDDTVGRAAKKRYLEDWYLPDGMAETIGDIHSSLKGKKLEDLISAEGKKRIKTSLGLGKLTKKQSARFFQDKLATGEKFSFDAETLKNIKLVFKSIDAHFEGGA